MKIKTINYFLLLRADGSISSLGGESLGVVAGHLDKDYPVIAELEIKRLWRDKSPVDRLVEEPIE